MSSFLLLASLLSRAGLWKSDVLTLRVFQGQSECVLFCQSWGPGLNCVPLVIFTWLYSFSLFPAEKYLQCRLWSHQGVFQSAFKLWPCRQCWLLFHVSHDVVSQWCSLPLWDDRSFWWIHLFWILKWSDDGNVKTKCRILWNVSWYTF